MNEHIPAVDATSGNVRTEIDLTSKREFLWNVHSYTNDYVQFADTKAAFCVGIATALMAALFASKAHDLFRSGGHPILAGLSLGAFVLLAISMGAAVMVVRPRDKESEDGLVFWKDIAGRDTADLFVSEYSAQTERDLNRSLSVHLYDLARVCIRKYFWVNVATFAGAAGSALAIIALLFKP
jgi:hypothetical protein